MCRALRSFVLVSSLFGLFQAATQAGDDLKEAADTAAAAGRKAALEAFKAPLAIQTRSFTGQIKMILSEKDPGKELHVVVTSVEIDDSQSLIAANAKVDVSGYVRLILPKVPEIVGGITAEGTLAAQITLRLETGSVGSEHFDRCSVRGIEARRAVLVVTDHPQSLNDEQRGLLTRAIDDAVRIAFQQNNAALLERTNNILADGKKARAGPDDAKLTAKGVVKEVDVRQHLLRIEARTTGTSVSSYARAPSSCIRTNHLRKGSKAPSSSPGRR